jgi:hypothetical protein
MRELLDLVEYDFAAFGPTVRARWDAFESATWREAEQIEREAARLEGPARATLLGDFSARATGVMSGGSSNSCLPTDNSFDANVAHYASYISQQGGADLNSASCGTGPQVGDPGAVVTPIVGALSADVPAQLQAFKVTAGTQELRIAMNAVDDGTSDFDMYVKQGTPPTMTDFDCRQNERSGLAGIEPCTRLVQVAG